MGAGIACVAAAAGYPVTLVDPDPATRERAGASISRDAERLGKAEAASHVTITSTLPTSSDAWLAIEAIPENLAAKRDAFASLSSILGDRAIFATNTSALSVAEIAAHVPVPQRLAGLHFFNPATRMQLVEVVRTAQTDDETVEALLAFVAALGKTPVLAADTPGFIVNRVARPFYLQSMHALERGVASLEELDSLARGLGFRMGPFELMDLIGLDVNLATSQSMFDRTAAPRLEPVQMQRDLVARGRLGRKTGAGFYEYAAGNPAHDDTEPESTLRNEDEVVAILGFGNAALEFAESLQDAYANVTAVPNDDLLEELPADVTIVIDTGDGSSDRTETIRRLDATLPAECVIFVDAYATDLTVLARRLTHPERIVGYGLLASLERQRCIEVVDAETTGDDALTLAEEFFESIGKRSILVENAPGLFLGRTVGSIVNEAVYAVDDGVATADDVDLAMQLGTNYPMGPIAWGREIGGARIARILRRLAEAEDPAFAPHRAMWILDAQEEPDDA